MLATEHSEGVSITAGMTTGCPSLKATPSDASIFQEIGLVDFPSIVDDELPVFLGKGCLVVMFLLIDNVLFYYWNLITGIGKGGISFSPTSKQWK